MKGICDRREWLGLSVGALAVSMQRLHAEEPKAGGLVVGQTHGAKAGLDVLAAGGNAVDAVVAAALVAGVAAVNSCGIGGYGGHMVIALPGGKKVTAIDFNSAAPAAARPDMFPLTEKGDVKEQVNAVGWLAAGVPGTLAGLQLALDRYGSKPFAQLVQPAIRHVRDGFAVSAGFSGAIKSALGHLQKDPGAARLLLDRGQPLAQGATYRNPDLAAMLEKLAEQKSVEAFYRGDIARQIAAAFKKHGGLVTVEDLASYQAVEVEPLRLDWRGASIYTPPPTSGGLTVLQSLATLKALGWDRLPADDPKTTHARLGAQRLAWHDRLTKLGDPKKTKVPVELLLSPRYVEGLAERVKAAVKDEKPLAIESDGRPAGGTIHLSAVDSQGMMVALTLTHGEAFGAKVAVDGLGLLLGHGMSRFDPRPERPNSPGPGKRPLHNMCPTVVLRESQPVAALGATGGRRIVNTVFDVLLQLVGRDATLAEAAAAPRLHTEGDLNLTAEARWPEATLAYLKKVGYTLKTGPAANFNGVAKEKAGAFTSAVR